MHKISIDGKSIAALGMGTWNMGDDPARRSEEIASLQAGLDGGLSVIDTAEMYGDGRSETLVGDAIRGRRHEAFLVTKVLPSHASCHGVQQACRASLRRLRTEHVELYLLHWPGAVPLDETIEGFERLRAEGLIGRWGISNFDIADMTDTGTLLRNCAANQILYNLEYRGVEFDLLPALRTAGMIAMAYSPLGQGGDLLRSGVLRRIAGRHETSQGPATAAQIALAWTLRHHDVLPIPKAGSARHQRENIAACDITLSTDDLAMLDATFAPPRRKIPLAMI